MILLFSFLWGLALFLGAEEVFAELPDYTPLVNLPGIQEGSTSIPAFINRVYIFTIVIGALLGVVKIALAGAKYSMGDVITNKEEAKKDIMGVLLGLVVLLAPWIVLNTIYPGLLNLDFTKNITNVGIQLEPSPLGDSGTYTELRSRECAAQVGWKWDPVCSECIKIDVTVGGSCGGDVANPITTSCGAFTLPESHTCESFCMILNGVYSEENDTCTYGGGSGSSGGGDTFYCFGINGGSDRLCYDTQDECENVWMVRNPDSDPDVLHCFTQNTPN